LLKIFECVCADDLNGDVELKSSSESEDNTERLSKYAYEISDWEVDKAEESEEKSSGSVPVKIATDGMLNLYIAGTLLLKILLEFQAHKENPDV
jgi:hypothetical protein